MERLTIDEIIAHCKRRVDHAEQFYGKGRFESVDMSHRIDKEYWEHRQSAEYLEELKEYRKAEEQGLLLRLPVAVGEEVYCIANFGEGYEICKNYVTSYQTAPKEIGGVIARGYMGANLGIVGKTVFATREEAESALAEKGGV